MRTAIIAYDLENVSPGENQKVRKALVANNALEGFVDRNINSPFNDFFYFRLPETTFLLDVANDRVSALQIGQNVLKIIYSITQKPSKVFVSFIDFSDHFVSN